MSTKITVTYKNAEYTLEYSRQAVKQMEDQGCNYIILNIF